MSTGTSMNGLVFGIDLSNKKSFLGAPGTNLHLPVANAWGYPNSEVWNVTGFREVADAPVPSAPTWRFTHSNVQPNGQTHQWTGWEYSNVNLTGAANEYIALSYWYKAYSCDGSPGVFYANDALFASDWASSFSTTSQYANTSIITDGKWRLGSSIRKVNVAYTNAIMTDGPAFITNGHAVVYVNAPTVTKTSYTVLPMATDTARTSTGVFADLAQKSTVNAVSLTYDYTGYLPSFNGTSDYLDLGNTLSGLVQTGEITVTTVAKISSVVQKNTLLSFNGAQSFFLPGNRLTTTNMLYWAGAWYSGGSTTWNTNQYYHLTWVISGTTLSFYVNGVLDGTATVPAFAPTVGTPTRVGLANAGEYAAGTIGLLTVHNRALSATEVKQTFNSVRTRFGI